LAFSTAVSCQLASAATFEINYFGFAITHSRLFLFTLAAMEAKLWNARARKETSQSGRDTEAETDAKVSFANESYRRRDVHNIDDFIMSLKICGLDNNDSFARERQGGKLFL
jgi:hypothetical protein